MRPAELELRGAVEVPRGVRFDPTVVTVGVERDPWPVRALAPWPADRVESARVTLRGDGAAGVLEAAGRSGTVAYAVIPNDDGRWLEAKLTNLGRSNGVVVGDIELSHIAGAGSYEGSLPLAPGTRDAPRLELAVDVGSSFFWTLAAVFTGALLGGVVPIFRSVGRRRRRLRATLKDARRAYTAQLRESGGRAAGYSLEQVPAIGSLPWDADAPGGDGMRRLWRDVGDARDVPALAALEPRLEEKVALVNRWLTVEAAAVELRRHVERLSGRSLAGTHLTNLSEVLLDRARRQPDSDSMATQLADGLRDQAVLLCLYERAVDLREALRESRMLVTERQQRRLDSVDLRSIDRLVPASQPPTVDVLDRVRTELRTAISRLEGLRDQLPHREGARPPPARIGELTNAPRGLVTYVRQGVQEHLSRSDRGPKSRAPTRIALVRTLVGGVDWFWTLLTVAAASAAYALTVYQPGTWGSLLDFVTAFTAGFGGKVVVDSLQINWPGIQGTLARAALRERPKDST